MAGHVVPLKTDQELAKLLKETRTIALVGASPKPQRPSHRVMKYLIDEGYDVYPVNPGKAGKELLGRRVYATLADVPVHIDMVDVFRQSNKVAALVDEAIALGAKAIWTQLDVIDYDAADRAEAAGMNVVMDRCPAIDLPRLRRLQLI
jgi:predicted CoA-binding protein